MRYDLTTLSEFVGHEISVISFDVLMECIVRINQPTRLKIYGIYRDVDGELVNTCIHRLHIANSYISMKIEYARRFKEFTVYSDSTTFNGLVNMYYRFIIQYINWYTKHQ